VEVRAMNDAITELEAAARGIPDKQPLAGRNQYTFVAIAHELAASLTKGAEDNLHEATALLDSVKILVEEIKKHVKEHADMLDDAHARTVAYGESVLAAHKEFINGGKHDNPTP
jgi:hypothetical protein